MFAPYAPEKSRPPDLSGGRSAPAHESVRFRAAVPSQRPDRYRSRIFLSAGSSTVNSLRKSVGVTSTTLMPVEAP